MKKMLLVAMIGMLALAWNAGAQETKGKKEGDRAPIRVLVVTGGHAYQEKEFDDMWAKFRGITTGKCKLPDQLDMLKPGLEKDYDVIVMYDMIKEVPEQARKDFMALLKTGIGLVSLHHDIGMTQDWPEYHKLIGGQYMTKPAVVDGAERSASTYEHDVDLKINVADKEHPITRGITDFDIHDEAYGNVYVAPTVHVLLTCDNPKMTKQVAWTNVTEGYPVFYLMLGHDAKAWDSREFREVLQRGIRWEVREAKGKLAGAGAGERKRNGAEGKERKAGERKKGERKAGKKQ